MAEREQQGKTPTEPHSEVKDVLLAAYKEHADEARQHETQRERMTNLIIVIGAGSLALATTRVEGISLSLLGLVLVVLGLYGAVSASNTTSATDGTWLC